MSALIGLTGGIGSGKTTVAKIFEELGIPVFIADDEGKKITNSPETKEKIIKLFGNNVVNQGEINRNILADLVFNNSLALEQLNSIIHPEVKKQFEIWCHDNKNRSYLIYESAILLESNNSNIFSKIITVSAPEHLRIMRVKQRNNFSDEDVKRRIRKQWTDIQREEKADYVINNIELENTKEQVQAIYTDLMKVKANN